MPPPAFPIHLVTTRSGREVGYRRGGDGSPVVLLHESPRSSAALLPLAQRLAAGCTVFALDTPGFGHSDPLAVTRPAAEDFADALIETLDALGLGRVPLYGTHTGAVIAMSAACRHPDRVSRVVLDGYPVFTGADKEEFLAGYLAPFQPGWDGAHLAWLWGRVKDQFTFFPWYRRGDAARLPRPLPSLDLLQNVAVDLMAAGDHYRPAYASAFRFDAVAALAELEVPAMFAARSDDLLFGHLDRLAALPDTSEVARLGPDRDAWVGAIGSFLGQGGGDPAPAAPAAALPEPGAAPRRLTVATPHGTLALRVRGSGRALVLLPGIPGSAAGCDDLARALGRERRVITVDLPGVGASTPLAPGTSPAEVIAEALALLGVDTHDVIAFGESAAIGATLTPASGRFVAVAAVPDDAAIRRGLVDALTDITPRADGTHLLAAWHELRDRELWRPWTERAPAFARRFGTDPDPARLHEVLTGWMRGGPAVAELLAVTLDAPLGPALAALGSRATLIDHPAHPWAEATQAAAGTHSARFVAAGDGSGLVAAIFAALEDAP